jgi:hypothetical protein
MLTLSWHVARSCVMKNQLLKWAWIVIVGLVCASFIVELLPR